MEKEGGETRQADAKFKSETAQKPIKKRTGRSPIRRMLPVKVKPQDPEVFMTEQTERERMLSGKVPDS
jgi:hypothetical protein